MYIQNDEDNKSDYIEQCNIENCETTQTLRSGSALIAKLQLMKCNGNDKNTVYDLAVQNINNSDILAMNIL